MSDTMVLGREMAIHQTICFFLLSKKVALKVAVVVYRWISSYNAYHLESALFSPIRHESR